MHQVRGWYSGAVVTFGAGAFNLVNAVAGAYAERSPVVVIAGAPASSVPVLQRRPTGPDALLECASEIIERLTAAKGARSSWTWKSGVMVSKAALRH